MFKEKLADVIIISYNRNELLLQILEKLNTQTIKDFNVIVSDDGSKELINPSKYPIINKFIWAKDEGYGRVSALNAAINLSVSKKLIFLDDDTIPQYSNWLETHLNNLKDHELSSGRIYFPFEKAYAAGWFSTTNLAIHSDLIKKVGGFDKNLDGEYGQEDIILSLELKKYGVTKRIADVENTLAHHVGKMYADGDRSDKIVGVNVRYCIEKYGIDPRKGIPW